VQLAVVAVLAVCGGLAARQWILRVEEPPVLDGPVRFYAQQSSLGRSELSDARSVYLFAWNVTNKSLLIKGERSSPTYGLRQYLADGECLASTTSFTPNHRPASESWTELRPDEVLPVYFPLSDTTVAFELGLLYREQHQSSASDPQWLFSERFHLSELNGLTFAVNALPSERETGVSDESAKTEP
jgi:hypothetical protein